MKFLAFIVGTLLATSAYAQGVPIRQPSVDPRIANEVIDTLKAQLTLSFKYSETLKQDMAKREKDWAEYSKPLWDFK